MPAAMTALVAAAIEVGTDVAEAFDAHDAGGGGLPQLHAPDFAPQLFWLAVTFALLYWIMAKIALPRIGEVIEERQDRIQRDLAAAERLKGETEKALAAYEQELAAARGRAGSIARDTREKLAAEVEQERARVDSQVNAKLTDAEKRIADMKARALAQVNEIATDTAGSIVEKLIGAEVSAEEARGALEPVPGE